MLCSDVVGRVSFKEDMQYEWLDVSHLRGILPKIARYSARNNVKK